MVEQNREIGQVRGKRLLNEGSAVGSSIRSLTPAIQTAGTLLLHLYATLDERGAKMYAGQIRGGQDGLYLRGMVCGKLCQSGHYEVRPVQVRFAEVADRDKTGRPRRKELSGNSLPRGRCIGTVQDEHNSLHVGSPW